MHVRINCAARAPRGCSYLAGGKVNRDGEKG